MLPALFFAISYLKILVLLHVHVHVEATHTFCTCGSDAILQKAVLQCKKRLFYRGSQFHLWILVAWGWDSPYESGGDARRLA